MDTPPPRCAASRARQRPLLLRPFYRQFFFPLDHGGKRILWLSQCYIGRACLSHCLLWSFESSGDPLPHLTPLESSQNVIIISFIIMQRPHTARSLSSSFLTRRNEKLSLFTPPNFQPLETLRKQTGLKCLRRSFEIRRTIHRQARSWWIFWFILPHFRVKKLIKNCTNLHQDNFLFEICIQTTKLEPQNLS